MIIDFTENRTPPPAFQSQLENYATVSLRKHRQTLANKRGEERKNSSRFFLFFFFSPLTKMDRSKSPNPKLRGGNRKRRRVGGELNSRTIPGRAASGNERERIRRVCRLQPRFRVSNGARPRSRKPR